MPQPGGTYRFKEYANLANAAGLEQIILRLQGLIKQLVQMRQLDF